MDKKLPVLILAFKRFDSLVRIKEVLSQKDDIILYVVADGWRDDMEKVECLKARELFDDIPAEQKLFRMENLGCRESILRGIDWFFSNTAEGIILEDDCIPDLSFLHLAQELLDKYRDNQKIVHIGGSNFLHNSNIHIPDSYYFSYLNHPLGWATWRRTWEHFRNSRGLFEWNQHSQEQKDIFLGKIWKHNSIIEEYWRYLFDTLSVKATEKYIWDVEWTYYCWSIAGISILPQKNLIENVGFLDGKGAGKGGKKEYKKYMGATGGRVSLQFPLVHPGTIGIRHDADVYFMKTFAGLGWLSYCRTKIIRFIKLFYHF